MDRIRTVLKQLTKHKLWVAVAFVVTLCLSAYIVAYPILPVYPIVYADGSVEYALIRRQTYESVQDDTGRILSQKIVDRHWILRFPGLVSCFETDGEGRCETYEAKRQLPELDYGKLPPKNAGLDFELKLPDLTFLQIGDDPFGSDVMGVGVNYVHTRYRSKSPGGNWSGFVGTLGSNYEIRCKKDRKIAKGVFKLRDNTQEEKAKIPKQYSYLRNDDCGPAGFTKTIQYAFYDEANNFRGGGSCDDKLVANCRFTVWLPQNRQAQIWFKIKHLKNLAKIYNDLISFFNQATVVEKSKNLYWGASRE